MITAIDIGGTKTLIAQFNKNMEQTTHIKFPTPPIPADFVRTLNEHLSTVHDITALAIGLPGQISDDDSTVLYCGNLPWRNVPLKSMLAETHKCPIYLENDAAMGGIGEMNSLTPVPRLGYYLSLGTGIGGATIVQGKLMPALNRSEPGHMMLKNGDTWTEWEDLASGKAIAAHFNKMAADLDQPEQWQWVAEGIAQGLSPIIATLLPDTIVMGGGIGRFFDAYQGFLAEKLRRRLPDYIPIPKLLGAQRADDAVIYGCYYHATHRLPS